MDPIPLDPTVQPQPEQYPPGSAIPIDDSGNVIDPGKAPEPPPVEEEPLKKKVVNQKEEVKKMPKMYFHPKKPKVPRVHKARAKIGSKLKGLSKTGHHKPHRSSMSHHSLRGSY